MALPAGWAWLNGRLRPTRLRPARLRPTRLRPTRLRPTADPRGRGSLIFGDSRSESRSEPRFEQARDGDRPPAFKPNVTLGRALGQKLPSARVSHTGMVEDRIGWTTSLVGRPIPVTLISQTAQRLSALKSTQSAHSTDAQPYTTGVPQKSGLWANGRSVDLTFSLIRAPNQVWSDVRKSGNRWCIFQQSCL
jgi:hypothetical protein